MKLRYLHISDLHLTARPEVDEGWAARQFNEDLVTTSLVEAIKGLVQEGEKALDLVFITGDLARRGKPDEYKVVQVFCEKLLAVTGLPPERLFLVPGNHDVDRSHIDERHLKWWYAFEKQGDVADVLGSTEAFPALMRKFAAFNDFATRVMGRRLYDASHYYWAEPVPIAKGSRRFTINVAGLNSALFAGYDGDDERRLALGLPQVSGALGQFDKDALLSVLLFHHPFECFHPADRVCQNLLTQAADLILTGHLHRPDNLFARGAAGTTVLVGAGASYETRTSENSFNLVEIDLATGAGQVQFYKYLPDFHRWKENTDANPSDERGIFRFEIERLARLAQELGLAEPEQPAEVEPYEARLVIRRDGDDYAAQWKDPEGGESDDFPLVLTLTAADTSDLRWYLETYLQFPGAGDRARAGRIERAITGWGRRLFDAVLHTAEGAPVFTRLMAAAESGRPCVLTLCASDPDVLVQPWEVVRDRDARPLTFQGVTVRRQLRPTAAGLDLALGLPLRVLLIVSRPTNAGQIDPRVSTLPLLQALEALPAGQVQVDFCQPPTLSRLEETIREARRTGQPYHIVHFDGHGAYMPQTGVGALAFERDNAQEHLVTGREVGDLLVRLKVPLVLLEACQGANLSDRPVFGSVAPALLESGVGSVIAFSHAVHIEAARLLVERFYRELCAGLTVGQSLEEARRRLRANPARWLHRGPGADTIDLQDWFIPQLYQVGADPVLVDPEAAASATAAAVTSGEEPERGHVFHNFPPPPLYQFHGRALELLELERAFRRHPAVVVSGMGGMGKTALAREAAHWWQRKGMFEAAVFVSFEQAGGAGRVVQLLGEALEGPDFHSRSEAEQRQAAVDLFHSRRILLVWDNFESTLPAFQAESAPTAGTELLDAPTAFTDEARAELQRLYRDLSQSPASNLQLPSSRLLITCRPANTGLPAAKAFPLSGLARPDSLYLLAAVLDLKGIRVDDAGGKARRGYEREEIDKLLEALADHPLSVELVAPHLKDLAPEQILADYDSLLEGFAAGDAFESRNRSLLASLEFSRRHLSPEAQAVLPYLGWFQGGVFEQFLLDFAELDAGAWAPVRAELVDTALLSVEEPPEFNTPYLRFHPTLPYAARATEPAEPPAGSKPAGGLEERFIGLYLSVMRLADEALRGQQPAAGMALLAREQSNFRAALARAFAGGARQEGARLADTLRLYLEMAGRLRDRDALVTWVREQMPDTERLDGATCGAIWQHAWSTFTQGRTGEAIEQVEALLARLDAEGLAGGEDPAFQIALGHRTQSRIYVNANRPELALAPAQKASALFETLTGDTARGNLAAALGDVANAYRALGRFDEALEANEQALAIQRDLGRQREIAAGLGITAQILSTQQRHAEADARYDEAQLAARAAGDLGLQGLLLQHQAGSLGEQGGYDRAVALCQQAITLHQQAGDLSEEMRTCNLLASAEMQRGHLDAAEAWYARSRELAIQLGDRAQQAAVAQNVGILYQTRAGAAGDPRTRDALLRQAVASVEESLAIRLEMRNPSFTSESYFQLGVLHRMLGDLDKAEENARQALEIHESLNLPDVYKSYGSLAGIARDRGDAAAAARWQAKSEAKVAELERLRRGEGTETGEGARQEERAKVVDFVLALAQAAYAAVRPLPPDAAEALAQLAAAGPPLGAVGLFLQAVAAGEEVPLLPAGLPDELAQILEALVAALEGE